MAKTAKRKGDSSIGFTFRFSAPVAKLVQSQPNMTAFIERLVAAHAESLKTKKVVKDLL